MKSALIALLTMFGSTSFAAPHPATSTSVLTDPAKGLFFHGFGFRLKSLGGDWKPTVPGTTSNFNVVRFEPREDSSGAAPELSIRTDRLQEDKSLESYSRRWIRDYASYGFDVLGTRPLQMGGGKALLIDLVQKTKNRQLRQVIFEKDRRIAVMTCLDQTDRFDKALESCNRMIRQFEWADGK
jgi:hypothetical protein